MIKQKLLLILILIIFYEVVHAKDFGKVGTSFEIKEEGFLTMIYRKLKAVDVEKEQKKMQELARKKIEEPDPVEGIVKAQKNRNFMYDPTYILPDNVYLPDGNLLYFAGTKINPLDYVSLEKKLIFIDGRDREQVKWFKRQIDQEYINEKDKLILIGGRPFDLEKELERLIYFDQHGFLTSKFEIKAVPALVMQKGKFLKIEEFMLGG